MSNHKLPHYHIEIDPYDWKEMQKDVWSEDPVVANLIVGNNKYDIDFVHRGSHIRKVTKKSYQFLFPQVTAGIKELHLNAEYIDKSLIRNKLSLDFFSSIGVLSPSSSHVLITINDNFQGVYLQLESVDRYFLKRRNLPHGPIFYAENDNANFSLVSPIDEDLKRRFESGYSRKEGTSEDKEALRELVYQINTIPPKKFEEEIQDYVEVDKYLRWLAGVVCTQNYDGFIHNYALYRRSDTGQFEMIPWDYDATWGRDIHGKEMEYDYIPIEGYNTLSGRLLDVPSFRERYYHLMKDILNKQFTVEYQKPIIDSLYEKITPHVEKDPFMKKHLERFYEEPEVIFEYINDRNRYLKRHLADLL
ncbi:CotH kinase family protein [Pseudalkalibacillus berkeleyi]|uniref:CotH kinase family protein n=1 Tax=Pseudalkalibacillus berkeleyi TaxID=1069813 RepID=A0ABS9GUW7_9BACL|nr:CotH kinase family protein [Pseudalkalibacillus berkeleyi]MCF6136632.1 CotH kinase family protein [Pseudalkalibacillus berkeleyi]